MAILHPMPDDSAVMQPTSVRDVELLRAHFVRHSFERHSHEAWSLGATLAGNQTFRCRGTTSTSRRGNLIVFRPDEAHDGHGEDESGFEYAMLYLPDALVDGWLRESGRSNRLPVFREALIHDPACAAALLRAADALTESTESLRAESLLCGVVIDLFSRHASHVPRPSFERPTAKWLERVRDCLEADYARNLTVDDLARIAHVSRVHLTRAFTDAFGVPPHVHLNAVRLRAAKAMLASGTPIADVAASVGFSDQSHLNRRFRGSFGMTPATWLRQMHGRR